MARARGTLGGDEAPATWNPTDHFTDRHIEAGAFSAALTTHRRRLDGDETIEHPQGRNVLVFHGHGGLGKSELSRRLEAWSHDRPTAPSAWGPAPGKEGGVPAVAATARVDLYLTQGYLDGAQTLAEIRIEIGHLKKNWPLFDLAFATYWAQTHPGLPLPVTADKATSLEFEQQVADVLLQLSGVDDGVATLVSLGIRALGWVNTDLAPRIAHRFGIGVPEGFEELRRRCANEPTPDDPHPELIAELARLLTYELDTVSGTTKPVPLTVVFLDTFERLSQDARGEGERLINQLVWQMDNVLFVVTGREPLTWSDVDGFVPRRGPRQWPLLAPHTDQEPRQHQLGYLPSADRIDLLATARAKYGLSISDDVLRLIADRSGGLPEYLRLAIEDARVKTNNGIAVTADLVAGNLESLVRRLFEDVPAEQQAVIRAATLFPAADPSLVAAAAGTSEGTAEAAIARPFFDSVNVVAGRRVMHDTVRGVIREAQSRGGWTVADWDAAGSRALELLRRRRDDARSVLITATAGRNAVAAADATQALLWNTAMAVTVICEVTASAGASHSPAAYPDWVAEAIVKGPSIVGLRPHLPATARTAYGQELLDFIQAKSAVLTIEENLAVLRRLFVTSERFGWIAGRHLGYALSATGRWADAAAVFDTMLTQRPTSLLIKRQRRLVEASRRRYRTLQETLERLPSQEVGGLALRIERDHGRHTAWIDAAAGRVTKQRDDGRIKDSLETEGMWLIFRAFRAQEDLRAEILDYRDRVLVAGHATGQRDAALARILLEGPSAAEELVPLDQFDVRRNGGEIGYRSSWARLALAYLADDDAAIQALAHAVSRRQGPRSPFWIPVETLLEHLGHPVAAADAEWLEPWDMVAGRWVSLWQNWRQQVSRRTVAA